ncbi:hypothetical protein GE061_001323 [Apolygus lucorum]|uniref:Endonuclease/exonuclease/phosphatase domain-containing protein n=1 Tax=Apolygus lucorum TaxID=248454 RepID=A0A8S9Y6R2_APOLU|nr:hypothetical protein GE061_001323 [Apolygus lucorum]
MNLLFTRQELQEIFNTKKPAAPLRPRPPSRPRIQQVSPPGENSRKPAKQPSCTDHRSGPMQQSPPDRAPLPRLPIRRRADKSRVLSSTTTARCERIKHTSPRNTHPLTWKVVPIDVPNFKKRADVVARFYHAQNARQFEPYVPNCVDPQQRDIHASLSDIIAATKQDGVVDDESKGVIKFFGRGKKKKTKATKFEDFVTLTYVEAVTGPDLDSKELWLSNFNVYRSDRSHHNNALKSSGGGVLIAVSAKLRSFEWRGSNEVEHVFVVLPDFRAILGCIYFPGYQPVALLDLHLVQLDDLSMAYPGYSIILAGDYNIPGIHWDIWNSMVSPADFNPKCRSLYEAIRLHDLQQFNFLPNIHNNVLDLLLTSVRGVTLRACTPIVDPDPAHPPFEFIVPISTHVQTIHTPVMLKYNFVKESDRY